VSESATVPTELIDRLSVLEAALANAREHSRVARRALKEAKVLAKVAKKHKRQARRALVELLEQIEAQSATTRKSITASMDNNRSEGEAGTSNDTVVGSRIADSPERQRRRKGGKRSRQPSVAQPVSDS
jgi:hypothetical protein